MDACPEDFVNEILRVGSVNIAGSWVSAVCHFFERLLRSEVWTGPKRQSFLKDVTKLLHLRKTVLVKWGVELEFLVEQN